MKRNLIFLKRNKKSIITLYKNKGKKIRFSFFAKKCSNSLLKYETMKHQKESIAKTNSIENLEECLYESYSDFVENIKNNKRIAITKLYVPNCKN